MSQNDKPLAKGKLKDSQDVKDLSNKAKVKGIGSLSDPSVLHEIKVTVTPSSICQYYAEEQFDSLQFGVMYKTGVAEVTLPFTPQDLYMYYSILIRERVNDVNKRRVLFSPRDVDVKIPHFFYLMLASLGEVVDERRHLFLKLEFDATEVVEQQRLYYIKHHGSPSPTDNNAAETLNFKMYSGVENEREFVYDMSKQLKLMERYGLVNGSGLPRGLEGTLDFMLFVWAESRINHPDPEVEPGLSVLASLLRFSRDTTILNPYIAYGTEVAYRVFIRDMTVLRGTE